MRSSFCASFLEHHRAGAGGDGRCWLRLPVRHHCHGNAAVVSFGSRAAAATPNARIATSSSSSSSQASDWGKPPIVKEGCFRQRVLPAHTRTFGCSPHGAPSRLRCGNAGSIPREPSLPLGNPATCTTGKRNLVLGNLGASMRAHQCLKNS